MINREIKDKIIEKINYNKTNYQKHNKKDAIILYGARQVGKTTLVKEILSNFSKESKYINCELIHNREKLEVHDDRVLKSFLGNNEIIILDEAQKIRNIGTTIKIIIDTYPEYQIIATGSSSFDLANKISEPLTGRHKKYMLFPLSFREISENITSQALVDNILVYGAYPEVTTRFYEEGEELAREKLDEITGSYLYKDIFELENIKKTDVVIKLLKLLALQIGNEVSSHELATLLKVNINTVESYIHLLEESFVVFKLSSFSRNLRKELGKKYKIYFYDLGIRNSLIQNYNSLSIRNDVGALWENFCILERLKHNQYHNRLVNSYFWRTYDQKELDYVEEHSGILEGFEFKWNENQGYKIPKIFLETYENSSVKKIDRSNFREFF